MFLSFFALLTLGLVHAASGHTAAFANGMYCRGGPNGGDDQNTNTAVSPLYGLSQSQWWFQADRGCDRSPPANGVFLDLPAGGRFTVELAHNRAQTTLSYDGAFTSAWPDGKEHPEDWNGWAADPGEGCIQDDGAMHVQDQAHATGTVFAISYNSEISQVNMQNLVVFSVLPNTPWKRIATYDVPADLPPCPANGCTCAWGWVPNGCGQPNVYMQGFRCRVTGSTSSRGVATAQVPRHCANNSGDCVRGAKQMLIYQQADGNNVQKPSNGFVAYDANWGFYPGAQNDIFE